jgi:hypothetical protein
MAPAVAKDGPPECSPLHPDGGYAGALRWAGPFTAQDVEDIRARVEYGALPWWRRWVTRRPYGWPR